MPKLKRVLLAVGPYLLVASIIVLRNLPLFDRPTFWAEDGDKFFVEALNQGPLSIFAPVEGYCFVIERLLSWIAVLFPLAWTPLLFILLALILNAWVAGYFSREGFSWLVPSRNGRIFVCALIALAPGSTEIYLNLVNLGTQLAFWVLLLLLEDPLELPWNKTVLLLPLLFSAGQSFLYAPIAVYFFFLSRDRRYLVLLGFFAFMIAVNFAGNHQSGTKAGFLDYSQISSVPGLFLAHGFLRAFLAPFLGSGITESFMTASPWVFWPVLVPSYGLALWFLYRAPIGRQKLFSLALAFACTFLSYGAIAITRRYAVPQVSRYSGSLMWAHRYSYLPSAVVIVLWCAALSWIYRSRPKLRWLAAAGLGALTVVVLAQWPLVAPRPDPTWSEKAAQISAAIDQRSKGQLSQTAVIPNITVYPHYYHHSRMAVVVRPDGTVGSSGRGETPL